MNHTIIVDNFKYTKLIEVLFIFEYYANQIFCTLKKIIKHESFYPNTVITYYYQL